MLAAALLSVVLFFPAEGHVMVPLHTIVQALLGQVSFTIPLALALTAALAFARRSQPSLPLPRRRLAGLALITIALLPAEHLLGQSTGLIGEWFTGFLLDLLGAPVAIVLTTSLIALGALLAFDVRHWKRPIAAR
jgi:DNA translocase FtsK/SpoIIIE-like protein